MVENCMINTSKFFYENITKTAYPDFQLPPTKELDAPVRCMCCGSVTTTVADKNPIKSNFTDFGALTYLSESAYTCPYCAFTLQDTIRRKIVNFILLPDGSYYRIKESPGSSIGLFKNGVDTPYLLSFITEKKFRNNGEEPKYEQGKGKHVIFKTGLTTDPDLIVANTSDGPLFIDRKRIIKLNDKLDEYFDTISGIKELPKFKGSRISPLVKMCSPKILPYLPQELTLLSDADLIGLALINGKVTPG